MEKVKEIFTKAKKVIIENKKVSITVGVALCLILVVGIVTFSIGLSMKNKELTSEEKVTQAMEEIGKDFYENFYYKQIGSDETSRANFLKKFETQGIKVTYDNLSRYVPKEEESANKKEKNSKIVEEFNCDKDVTKVVIYPQDPYGKEDYKIEVQLECEL